MRLLTAILALVAFEAPFAAAAVLSSPLLPSLSILDESSNAIPLLSLEAYRAEFRHLRKTLHEIDLSGPAIETDGWTHNIAEAEWPFMAFAYFGYSCANLAAIDTELRADYVDEMRFLINAMQTDRLSGFVSPHFGPPFGAGSSNVSVFVHGHFLTLAVRHRETTADAQFDALIQKVAEALDRAFASSDAGVLKSYRDMWWISDNLPALAGLARYDSLFRKDTRAVRERFLRTVKQHFIDGPTGLLATYVDADRYQILQGPRGISIMYGLHFLKNVSPEFAVDQYSRARALLVRDFLGLSAAREFPPGAEGRADIDSGPVFFGLGPSASGFAIAAAAVMNDETTAVSLLKAAALAGIPKLRNGELNYTAMPPVGQAVILFGKTELMRTRALKKRP